MGWELNKPPFQQVCCSTSQHAQWYIYIYIIHTYIYICFHTVSMFCIFTYICLHGWLNFVRHVREYTKWALIQLQVGAHNSASRRSAKINFWAEAVRLFGSGAKKVWTDQGWAWHCNHAKLTRIEFGWEVGIIIASLMRKARQKQRMRFVMIFKKSHWLGWHGNPRPECSTGGNTATGELLPFTERHSRQDGRRKWRLVPQVPRNL